MVVLEKSYHPTMMNSLKLRKDYLPDGSEPGIDAFVEYYNGQGAVTHRQFDSGGWVLQMLKEALTRLERQIQ
jgi:hypothetical protein